MGDNGKEQRQLLERDSGEGSCRVTKGTACCGQGTDLNQGFRKGFPSTVLGNQWDQEDD